MATKDQLLDALADHIGKGNGISAKQLALKIGVRERVLRTLITELRKDSIAVCGYPGGGYYLAKTQDDLKDTLEFLKNRALHSLTLASTLSKLPMADLIGQLHLKT